MRYVNSYVFVDVLSDMCADDDVIVTDVGFAYQCTHQAFRNKGTQRILSSNGLAPMGWGLPAAIGAYVGSKRRTICVVGDGGIMMNVQELATIAHYRFPIKIFVFNNAGYATMRQTQEFGFEGRIMGADADTGISFPDFHKLADAHGLPFVRASSHEVLRGAMCLTLDRPGPVLCEVMLDPKQIQAPRAVNRRNPDGTMNPTPIEDAYPYLPREIIEEEMKV